MPMFSLKICHHPNLNGEQCPNAATQNRSSYQVTAPKEKAMRNAAEASMVHKIIVH